MRSVSRIRWSEGSLEHISRHRVTPEEVEDVCFSEDVLLRSGREGSHYVLGRTEASRYLFVVVRSLRRGEAKVITAREMDAKERAYFRRRGK